MNINKPKIGDIIPFGEYNWRVLDVQGDKALIITEDMVEQRAYHDELVDIDIMWETCSLREYLNGEFLGKFDSSRILTAPIKNDSNLWYGTKGGRDTQDKIFLLSLEEVDYYFGSSGDYLNNRRKGWSVADKKLVPDNNGYLLSNSHDSSRAAKLDGSDCSWWLRSLGDKSCNATEVYSDGQVSVRGSHIVDIDDGGGVRPALWVKLREWSELA